MSKFAKFIHSPRLFFADSKSPVVRSVGTKIQRGLSSQDGTARFAYEPIEKLAKGSLPFVSMLAQGIQERARIHRTEVIQRHASPMVSVVMPAYNADATIGQAIESLCGQHHVNWELLVIDDASDDTTAAVVEKYTLKDPRVRLLTNYLGRGAALARNVGMEAATGTYLTFQDADDISDPERIEHQLAVLLDDTKAILSRCDYCRVDESGRPLRINGRVVAQSIISMMFNRTEVIDRVGYMQNIPVSEDFEFYRRIKLVFNNRSERHIFKCHYLAGFEPNSLLFSDGDTTVDSQDGVIHQRSVETEEGLSAIDEWHKQLRGGSDPYVSVDGRVRTPSE